MSDAVIRELVRALAAEPDAGRHASQLVRRLETELQHAGVMGNDSRLPELGEILRDAGLTVRHGDPEDPPWPGRRFTRFRTAEEKSAFHEREVQEIVAAHAENPSWMNEVQVEPEDSLSIWHAWEVPPIGAVVQRHWDTHKDGSAHVKIVVGAVCDGLTKRLDHCRSCDCFSLRWSVGYWALDEYWQAPSGEISPVRGADMIEGIVRGSDSPHCLRPSRVRIPIEHVRPSIREAYLAANPKIASAGAA